MKLEAMVTDSQFDELLNELDGDEINSVCRMTSLEGQKIPLVTASVSTDHFLKFAQLTQATPSKEQLNFGSWESVIFIDAYNGTPDYQADNKTGLLGVWTGIGEEGL